MTATLLTDILSVFALSVDSKGNKTPKVYGKRGERVTLISKLEEHQPVIAVQGRDGKRFPVPVKELRIEKQK